MKELFIKTSDVQVTKVDKESGHLELNIYVRLLRDRDGDIILTNETGEVLLVLEKDSMQGPDYQLLPFLIATI